MACCFNLFFIRPHGRTELNMIFNVFFEFDSIEPISKKHQNIEKARIQFDLTNSFELS
jgi:hypothetical protein